jgi:dTDP-4-amino-4,6-dideoxygalactose transaminase
MLIEDAAQAVGAEYAFSDGGIRRAGSIGQFGCFSFFPSKNLGAFGDGGMVTTNSSEICERLKVMRVHGSNPKYHHQVIGGNFRLDALQAAVLAVKLDYLDAWTDKRRRNAAVYRKLFSEAALEEVLPPVDQAYRHIYNQFVIKVRERRDELKQYLQEQGIGCEIYYPVPLHMQTCFKYLGYRPENFPVSLEASRTSLAIPVFPELEIEQQVYVVDMLKEFFQR